MEMSGINFFLLALVIDLFLGYCHTVRNRAEVLR